MKKIFICFLCILSILSLCSCETEKQPSLTPNPSSTKNPSLVDNVYFRKGETSDGEILFTEDDLQEVSIFQEPTFSNYGLLFTFTEDGKELLYQITLTLSQNEDRISIWIGNEQIACATVSEPLRDGKMQITGMALTQKTVTEWYHKFYGIAPAPTPSQMISEEILNDLLATVPDTFSYDDFEKLVSTNQLKAIPGPYQNTEKSAITSVPSLIDLAKKEVAETAIYDTIAYDANYKFWYISFESNDTAKTPYVVILTSEGITVTMYTLP